MSTGKCQECVSIRTSGLPNNAHWAENYLDGTPGVHLWVPMSLYAAVLLIIELTAAMFLWPPCVVRKRKPSSKIACVEIAKIQTQLCFVILILAKNFGINVVFSYRDPSWLFISPWAICRNRKYCGISFSLTALRLGIIQKRRLAHLTLGNSRNVSENKTHAFIWSSIWSCILFALVP